MGAEALVDSAASAGQIWRDAPARRRGIITGTIRSCSAQQTRAFSSATFNCSATTLCAVDTHGQVYAFFLHRNRYVVLKRSGARGVLTAFSATRPNELFVALHDGMIEVLHVETKGLLGVLRGHRHAVRSMACHSGQAMLLSCSTDAVMLWDTDRFMRLRALAMQPARPLQDAVFLPSGQLLATCFERAVMLWHTDTFEAAGACQVPPAHSAVRLKALATSNDSTLLLAAGAGGCAMLYSLLTHTSKTIVLPDDVGAVHQAAWLGRQDRFALLCGDGALRTLEPRNNELKLILAPPDG